MTIRTLDRYSVEHILPIIGLGKPKRKMSTPVGEFMVKMSSSRLECFKRNQTCVTCKKVGNIFLLQSHKRSPPRIKVNCHVIPCEWCRWSRAHNSFNARVRSWTDAHLNFFHQNAHGGLTLMTQDHIIPRSRGGSSDQNNLQTMCSPCNNRKGSKMPTHQRECSCKLCFAFPDAVVDWDSAIRLW